MTVKFRPLGNKVLIRADSAATKTETGIIFADAYQTASKEGTVVAVGPGSTPGYSMDVDVGDRVLFSYKNASAVNVDGSNYVLVPEPDILGIL